MATLQEYMSREPTGRNVNIYGQRVLYFDDGNCVVYARNGGARLYAHKGADLEQLDYTPTVMLSRELSALWRKAGKVDA